MKTLNKLNSVMCAHEHHSTVRFSIAGSEGGGGERFVQVQIHAQLPIVCQRCLEPLDYTLDVSHRYQLHDSDDDSAFGEAHDCEPLENKHADLSEFLADEIMLALPLNPMHDKTSCPNGKFTSA